MGYGKLGYKINTFTLNHNDAIGVGTSKEANLPSGKK